MTLTVIFLVLGGVLVVAWGWYSSGLVMKLERYPVSVLPAAFGLKFETVEFPSEDGVSLAGWFIPAPAPSDKTIVLCHGWGANRQDILPHTVFLQKRGGYNLFYFDFRNHGDSGGEVSSLGQLEMRDLNGALRWLREKKPAEAKRVALYGLSMGAAVSLNVAARDAAVAGVVAESPFSSFNGAVVRFGRLFYGVPRAPFVLMTLFVTRLRLGFDPEDVSPLKCVAGISPRPVFLIQGDKDARMPPSEGEALYAAAREPKTLWTIPGADHGEAAEIAGDEYQARVLEFYRRAFRQAGTGSSDAGAFAR